MSARARRDVMVCSACLTEACADGILLCEDAVLARIIFRERDFTLRG